MKMLRIFGGSGFGRFAGRGFGGQLCCPLVNT